MPPDNSAYFQAAYIITILLYVGYYLSLRWRARSVASRAAAIHAARTRRDAPATGIAAAPSGAGESA